MALNPEFACGKAHFKDASPGTPRFLMISSSPNRDEIRCRIKGRAIHLTVMVIFFEMIAGLKGKCLASPSTS